MNWKNLLESVSESVNDDLRLRHEYLLAENRIMRQQITGRVQLTDSERKELAELGAKLGKKALEEIATVAKPDTILTWNRKFTDQQVATSEPPKSVGRPRVDKAIEDVVIRMARENRSWGYDRMQGALHHLGYTISDQTVGNILKRHTIPPAPERKKTVTWREFVRFHMAVLRATDFFNGELWSGIGLILSSLCCFIHFSRDQVYAVGMTLRRQMQGPRSFVLWSLDVRSWVRVVRPGSRSRAIRCGKGVARSMVSACAPCDERPPGAPAMGKVVVLSTVHHRPIRDGPIPRRPRFDGLRKDDGRHAA